MTVIEANALKPGNIIKSLDDRDLGFVVVSNDGKNIGLMRVLLTDTNSSRPEELGEWTLVNMVNR